MDISIIVVTYNSANHIRACLQSLMEQSGVAFEVIVVDNASADNTLKELEGFNIHRIANHENVGFGRGNNAGFAASRGRYVYLLNPDACLVTPDALAQLCRKMDANSRWGMAGTTMLSEEGKIESPSSAGYPGDRFVQRDFSQLPGAIAWIVGASMIIRRELYERLNGFDPEFFLYSEETDFGLRMREIGFEIGHIPEVTVKHIGGGSEDMGDPYERSARMLRGLIRFRQKHYAPQECVFLAKRDLRRARFRMLWNGFLARLQPPKSKTWKKYRQYQGIWEVSQQYLSSLK